MKLLAGLAVMLLSTAGTAQAENWRLVVGSGGEMNSIDADAVELNGSKRIFPVLNMAAVVQPGWAYSISRWELDCDARTFRYLSGAAFDDSGAELNRHDRPGESEVIAANTGGEAWLQAVCQDKWPFPPSQGHESVAEEVAALSAVREFAR